MSKIDLKVRKIKTGETLVATLDSFKDAVTWLGERPDYMEVMGLLSEGLTPEQDQALREALRPYSEDERRLIAEADRAASDAIRKRLEQEQALAALRKREYTEAMHQADPNRPMSVHWDIEKGYSITDPYDPREVTDAARRAIEAWVAERTTWVEGRGMKVYEATVTVYPGPVPDGQEEHRVLPGGNFLPGPVDPVEQ